MTQIMATLLIFLKGRRILLAEKKDGFGQGLVNAFGGKIRGGEDIVQAAIREAREEVGLLVQAEDLQKMAVIKFFFANKFRWEMHVFLTENWQGEPQSSSEMSNPLWYDISNLPWNRMWTADLFWLPPVLAGKKIKAKIFYSADGSEVERITPLPLDF